MGMENYKEYYMEDFGFKEDRRGCLDDLNDKIFLRLEEFVYNPKPLIVKTLKVSFCFGLFATFVGVSSCRADILKSPLIRAGQTQTTEWLKPILEVAKTSKARPRGKGRRLGRYVETIEAQMLLKVFESDEARKALKLIPTLKLELAPQIILLPIRRHYAVKSVTSQVIKAGPKTKMSLTVALFSCVSCLSVGRFLIVPSLTDFLPLPPGSRVILSVLNRGRKYLSQRSKTDSPRYEEQESNNELDLFKDFLGSASKRLRGIKGASRGHKNFSFLPGTILLLLLAAFNRNKTVSRILKTTGLIPKKTYWQKINAFFKFGSKRQVLYVVISGSAILVVYLNREKIFSTVARVRQGDATTLGFDHLNGVFNEYKRFVKTSLDSAQKLSGDAFARLWRHQEDAAIEYKDVKVALEKSRLDVKKLEHSVYVLSLTSNENAQQGLSCQKELAGAKLDITKFQDFIELNQPKIESQGDNFKVEIDRIGEPQGNINLLDSSNIDVIFNNDLEDKTYPPDSNSKRRDQYKLRYEKLLEENKLIYPIKLHRVEAPVEGSQNNVILEEVTKVIGTVNTRNDQVLKPARPGILRKILKFIKGNNGKVKT